MFGYGPVAYGSSYDAHMGPQRRVRMRRSLNTVLVAVIATVVGVAALTVGAFFLFNSAADEQQQPAPSTALTFAVLAGSTVRNTGESVVNGDLGGAKTGHAITGFPPGVVNGAQHPGDAIALQARADLTTAYFEAANRSPGSELPPEVGGMTLTPEVYEQSTDLAVTGTLTLDGQNDPNALFIFQTTTLFTAPNSVISLINGAQACNVFWQVGNTVNVSPATTFVGSILATSTITLQAGATVDGRVLARNGEVVMDTNTVTMPSCSSTPPTGIPSTEALVGDAGQIPTTAAPPVAEAVQPGTTSSRGTTSGTGVTTAGSPPPVPPPGEPPPVDPPPVDPPPVDPPPVDPPPVDPPPVDPPPVDPPPVDPPPVDPPPVDPPPVDPPPVDPPAEPPPVEP